MNIDDVMDIIVWVHDEEGWDLGSFSSRSYRNEFFARAIGIVHHGHPFYNPNNADPQWHIKNAGGGRDQSDDVVVSMPSREWYDMIGGAGDDGYSFSVSGPHEPLPDNQEVYEPPVPDSGAGDGGEEPEPEDPIDPDEIWPPGTRLPPLHRRTNLTPIVDRRVSDAVKREMSSNAQGDTYFLDQSIINRTAVATGKVVQKVVDFSARYPPKYMQGYPINPEQPDYERREGFALDISDEVPSVDPRARNRQTLPGDDPKPDMPPVPNIDTDFPGGD